MHTFTVTFTFPFIYFRPAHLAVARSGGQEGAIPRICLGDLSTRANLNARQPLEVHDDVVVRELDGGGVPARQVGNMRSIT